MKPFSFKKFFVVLTVLILCFTCIPAAAFDGKSRHFDEDEDQLMVGAAVRDITPTDEMFPLSRKPNVILTGVLDPIHVRVIALSNGITTILMICSETGRSLGPQFADEVAKHTGLPIEAILNTSSHSHAAPEITEPLDLSFEDDSEATNQQIWARFALDQTLAAVDEALGNMTQATVAIAYSESYINVNRNATYNRIEEDGTVTQYTSLGYNPAGLSDKTLAAICFNDIDEKPIAFIINYSVHGTAMHANTILDGKTGVSSDIPGIVSGYLEDKYPKSVAMWLSGAAGDQNPIIQNNMYTRNPKTGEFEEIFSDSYDMLTYLSKIHFADIEAALSGIRKNKIVSKLNYKFIESTIPAKDGGDYGLSLQLIRIGDIAIVGFPGELYTYTGLYMKDHSLLKNTLIVNHAWQRTSQNNNYHPDDFTITINGFGADRAEYQKGFLDKELTSMMNKAIRETTSSFSLQE